MTAIRFPAAKFLSGADVDIPPAASVPQQIWCSIDLGITYFSDGVQWIPISVVAPGGPGDDFNFDTGNATQFKLVQVTGAWSLTYNTAIRRIPSGFSARFEVRPGDDPLHLGSGTERAEGIPGGGGPTGHGNFWDEGDEAWVGWSVYFPDSIITGEHYNPTLGTSKTNTWSDFHENRGAFQQFPSTANLPPITFSTDCTGAYPYKLRLRVSGGVLINGIAQTPPSFYTILDPLVYNRWHDFVVHVIHSSDPAIGKLELWVNGSRPSTIPSILTLATKYIEGGQSRQNYWKLGMYRSAQSGTSILYNDMGKFGASFNDVNPARFD
jgi:hypothetical protein